MRPTEEESRFRRRRNGSSGRRGLPIGGALAALGLWFGGMTAAALVVRPASVVAFGPPERLLAAAAATDAAFVEAGRNFVVLRPGSVAAVRALYAGGAWLVWPGLANGCGATGPRAPAGPPP